MFLKERRENICVVSRRELPLLLQTFLRWYFRICAVMVKIFNGTVDAHQNLPLQRQQ